MRRLARLLILVIPMSFLIGAFWTYYKKEQESSEAKLPRFEYQLRVLTLPGYLAPATLKLYSSTHQTEVEIEEAESELDFLDRAFSNPQAYDVFYFPSFHARTLIEGGLLSLIDHSKVDLDRISADFSHLQFDPKMKQVIPVSWGLNGFLVNTKKIQSLPDTVSEIMTRKEWRKKIALIPSPVELFAILKRKEHNLKEWVTTDKSHLINKRLSEIVTFFDLSQSNVLEELESENLWAAQMPHGQAEGFLSELKDDKFVYSILKASTTLWFGLTAISSESTNLVAAQEFINFLLSPEGSLIQAQKAFQATSTNNLNDSADVTPLLTAAYLRMVNLSHIDVLGEHAAFEPAWRESLTHVLPQQFSND